MKRFIAIALLAAMLLTAASADVLVSHVSESYCVAFSYDGQHALMMEQFPPENGMPHCRLYIRHADGSVSPLRDVASADADADTLQPEYAHVPYPAVANVRVCGNTLLMYVYASEYRSVFRVVDMTTGEAHSLGDRGVTTGVCGQQAALVINTASPSCWLLDGSSGEMTQQTIPGDVRIHAACPLSSGVLLCIREDDGKALLWLDEQGSEVHRLACEREYDQLYYDESTRTGVAASNTGYPSVWFNDYMMMQLLPPEITGNFETIDEFLSRLKSNPLYVSLLPEQTKRNRFSYSIQPLGMTDEGTVLCTLGSLGWFCTLDLATMELTPLLTEEDSVETVNKYAGSLYNTIWNGSTRFCLPSKLPPYQYIEIDHPALY